MHNNKNDNTFSEHPNTDLLTIIKAKGTNLYGEKLLMPLSEF